MLSQSDRSFQSRSRYSASTRHDSGTSGNVSFGVADAIRLIRNLLIFHAVPAHSFIFQSNRLTQTKRQVIPDTAILVMTHRFESQSA